MEILSIENLSFSYPDRKNKAVDRVSLKINEGEFVVLCGYTGSGKTTLLRLIKRELSPYGNIEGRILLFGKDIAGMTARESAVNIGYVMQNPEMQIVTDKVWHEMAFGLENLGWPSDKIKLRVAETAAYLGIDRWFGNSTDTLSGGQKQLLCLASVLAMSPKLLLLDEPTAYLDPVAASEFISALKRINRELGITVIIAEHRLEEIFRIADRVAVMENGTVAAFGEPGEICFAMRNTDIFNGFPSAARIAAKLCDIIKLSSESVGEKKAALPVTVAECRSLISSFPHAALPIKEPDDNRDTAVCVNEAWFRYEKSASDILRGTTIKIPCGEIFSILGGNGCGKSTLLKNIAGILHPYRGEIRIFDKKIGEYRNDLYRHCVSLVIQNAETAFVREKLIDEFRNVCKAMNYSKSETDDEISKAADFFGLNSLLDVHPYDLSGGEMRKAAIAKATLSKPRILLLDEPTAGLDASTEKELIKLLVKMKTDGRTVVIVTHDVEFAAEVSDRCALMFDGNLTAPDCPQRFFSDNNFYTTAARRIARGVFDNAVTVDEVADAGRRAGNV